MDPDTPTHFNAVLVGTGLVESIAAAALSKAGYSVLQLDQQSYYGDTWASLSLQELAEWATSHPAAQCYPPSPPEHLLPTGQRFSLSLFPTLLRANGSAIDLLVKSKVASYLSFGLLNGAGLWSAQAEQGAEGKGIGKMERVPASKADVFNHPTLSLVEKRRLTKLLLFAAGQDAFEEDQRLKDPAVTFQDFLQKEVKVSPAVASSLAYALTLCSSSEDLAVPSLQRLRSFIHSIGRYGASPFLVGHYGGAGDLVGGFSRICAVWGGGQILGRPIQALQLDSTPGIIVPPSQAPFLVHDTLPPPPSKPSTEAASDVKPLGIPVLIEPDKPASVFTADWVVASPSHLPALFPSSLPSTTEPPRAVHAIIILPEPIPFPRPREAAEDGNEPDSNLFVFEPKALREELGTVTALQVGPGTFAAPAGSCVLYLSAPLLTPPAPSTHASTLLTPYLTSLLALSPTTLTPLYTVTYLSTPPPLPPSSLPPNLIVVPTLPSQGEAASIAGGLDEAVEEAERVFWRIVGEVGRKEGVEFFAKGVETGEDE